MKIAIVDYCKGNLRSVQKGIEFVGGDAFIAATSEEMLQADGLVLPGVGAFADASATMLANGQMQTVRDMVGRGTPFLGICLGLHLLFEYGTEGGDGHSEGLGVLSGMCDRMGDGAAAGAVGTVKIPHVGWNTVDFAPGCSCPLFDGIPSGSHFYFTHSYKCNPSDPGTIAATTVHASRFASAVWKDNVFGVQFHPEKSSGLGMKVLENFVKIVCRAGADDGAQGAGR